MKACNVVLFALPLIPAADPTTSEPPGNSVVVFTDASPPLLASEMPVPRTVILPPEVSVWESTIC